MWLVSSDILTTKKPYLDSFLFEFAEVVVVGDHISDDGLLVGGVHEHVLIIINIVRNFSRPCKDSLLGTYEANLTTDYNSVSESASGNVDLDPGTKKKSTIIIKIKLKKKKSLILFNIRE